MVTKGMGSMARMRHVVCVIRAVAFNESDVNVTSPSPLLYDTYYHIYNRGVNGEDIFVEERNYDLFLRLYEKHLTPVSDLLTYCLLRNHFHLSVRIKSEEEIFDSRKTLKVSTPNTRHDAQEPFPEPDERSPGKPL